MKNEWWENFFDEGYLNLYADKVNKNKTFQETNFLIELFNEKEVVEVLDLAYGQGRHSIELAKAGFKVVGLDYSKDLLEIARKETEKDNLKINFLNYDMRKLPFSDSIFDSVMNIFTSFGFFENELDNEKVLSEVWRVLKEDGLFILDLPNHDLILKEPEYHREKIGPNSLETVSHGHYNIISKKWNVNNVWKKNNKKIEKTFNIRIYSFEEIKYLLEKHNFTVKNFLGSFNGEPYLKSSKRMIVLAEKHKMAK